MMIRREISGLHQYDKRTGFHVLFDEVNISKEEAMKCGPRHLSLMLTRKCNLNCSFCYVEKSNADAPLDFLYNVCEVAKELQVLDLTLGGGEPTLYDNFVEFIFHAWNNYNFGISVTTNATDIEPLIKVAGMLSSVRISVDNKSRPINQKLSQNISKLEMIHKVGANILWSPDSASWAQEAISQLALLGVSNFLIIPEHINGNYILNEKDWINLDKYIQEQSENYQIMVTSDAVDKITTPFLPTENDSEYSFAHIDESGNVRRRSWETSIGKAQDKMNILFFLQQLNPLRRIKNENLV